MMTLMTNWPLQNELPLAALPNAAYWARRHADEVLRDWKLDADDALVYRVKLIVSELVTNAAIANGHRLSDDDRRRYNDQPMSVSYMNLAALGQVRLRLSSDGSSQVLVEVGDESGEPPVRQTPGMESEHGRGLLLVESLCDGWGWYPITTMGDARAPGDKTRKVVWAKIRLSPLP
jgi:hypothetical protein